MALLHGVPVCAAAAPAELRSAAIRSEEEVHDIVIVGAGIAGLATALAFHRLGLKALVIEKSSGLRAGGTSLSLWSNAWRALDVLGAGADLRKSYLLLSGSDVISSEGELIHHLSFGNSSPDMLNNEVRAVERSALLESLAQPLPQDTVRFSSKVVRISRSTKQGEPYTQVQLEDGRVARSKVLVGCDGVRSEVAKYLGIPEPNFVGQCAIRGIANFPGGHSYGQTLQQYLGSGTRAGIVPVTSTKLYWFVAFKSLSPDVKDATPEQLKAEALQHFARCCRKRMKVFEEIVDKSPEELVTRNSLRDRWSGPLRNTGIVTLAGDALHPLTPNLGQGGCLALEDAVVLARQLHSALVTRGGDGELLSIQQAVNRYHRERWRRYFPLTLRSNLIGYVSMLEAWPVPLLRDSVGVKVALQPSTFLSHTKFDCGPLLL